MTDGYRDMPLMTIPALVHRGTSMPRERVHTQPWLANEFVYAVPRVYVHLRTDIRCCSIELSSIVLLACIRGEEARREHQDRTCSGY